VTLDLALIRDAIPALSRCTYLNCGTFGPNPTVVADAVVGRMRHTEAEGPINPEVYAAALASYEDARGEVASLLGTATD
jgi:selenocysteine lyase/cysteine desulfurase